jgi:hypothetical protein
VLGLQPLLHDGESNPHFDLGGTILAIRQGPPTLFNV